MITAWVFYYCEKLGTHQFELRAGIRFDSTDPFDWGLAVGDTILLVLQNGSFITAYLYGTPIRR